MFGTLRTTLALMVMVFHIYIGDLPLGAYAVFGFFIISGYLMTFIMQESYGYTSKGRMSFAINRFLRLHPLYWLACLVSIALIVVLGSDIVHGFHRSMEIPTSLSNLVQNIFMVFPSWVPGSVHPRLVPPTWAITIEMFYYALICLGLSKTFFRVKLWMFLSLVYVAYTFANGMPWQSRYFHIFAASLPFSIGACIYFISKNNSFQRYFGGLLLNSKSLFLIMMINCIIWVLVPRKAFGPYYEIGFYINILICSLLIYSIAIGGVVFNMSRKLDKMIGDYSYPIYLLHLQGGLLSSYLLFGKAHNFHNANPSSTINFVLALIIVVSLSAIFINYFEKPIQKIRQRIKNN
ncbi:MAG: acyltransferase family protein [Marinicellaceae bacterium]